MYRTPSSLESFVLIIASPVILSSAQPRRDQHVSGSWREGTGEPQRPFCLALTHPDSPVKQKGGKPHTTQVWASLDHYCKSLRVAQSFPGHTFSFRDFWLKESCKEETGWGEEEEEDETDSKRPLVVKEGRRSVRRRTAAPFAGATPTPMPHNKWDSGFLRPGNTHLAPAQAGHHPNQYATCRPGGAGEPGPQVNVGTTALWKHLKSMHKDELEKSGHGQAGQRQDLRPPGSQSSHGYWGRLGQAPEQVGPLALRAPKRKGTSEEGEGGGMAGAGGGEARTSPGGGGKGHLEMRRKVRAEKEACQRERPARGSSPLSFCWNGSEIYSENTHLDP